MRELPIGVQDFRMLRRNNLLYVDKTARLLELIKNGRRYFLSRPRRFGKSLTLSTLEAMFSGKSELFSGLSAESWVKEQSKEFVPVLRFDMSAREFSTVELFYDSLKIMISRSARRFRVNLTSNILSDMLDELLENLNERHGNVVVLIDEYDKPILDNITNLDKAQELREVLRTFYTALKSCDEYLRFVFITGISKFSKVGVFSAMNNLLDISLLEQYGDITGYTQEELENNFAEWIDFIAEKKQQGREEILSGLKEYYDGFSFDGVTRLYNPYSILSFFVSREFNNYWYESGSPSFIVEWMKEHKIQSPEEYRHKVVRNDFISSQEIEHADASSFLFQSGYLTIESKEGYLLTLDYPNREVLDSISSMYLNLVYKIDGYALLGNKIWKALREGNVPEVVRLYNVALSGIPYDDYVRNRNEYWYRSMFVMLLRGAGIIAYSEPHTSKGRADVIIQFNSLVVVLEFKFAINSSEMEEKKRQGFEQMQDRGYAKGYDGEGRKIVSAVLVADDEQRQIIL